jgi:hypothetical protein
MRFTRPLVPGLLALLPLLAHTAPAAGQCAPGPGPLAGVAACPGAEPYDSPRWSNHLTAFGANVLLGGLTAGFAQELRGGSFRDGFIRGALGGTTVYAGKRIAGQRFDGAGLLGRQVAAVGTSVVRNASAGRGSFSRLMLPFGPVRLYVEPGAARPLQPKLDLSGLAFLAYGVFNDDLYFDTRRSFSAGIPVFRTEDAPIDWLTDGSELEGLATAGVVYLADYWSREERDHTFAHERIHVLQTDFVLGAWTDPVEDWALSHHPVGRSIARWVDINLATNLLSLLGGPFDHDERPWEAEADYMAGRPPSGCFGTGLLDSGRAGLSWREPVTAP